MARHEVRFLPEDRVWRGDAPVPLALAASDVDIVLEQPCGSRTSCGRCRVRVVDGAAPASATDREALGPVAVGDGWRLGCRVVIDGDLVVEVPSTSRVVAHKTFGEEVPFEAIEPVADDGFGLAMDLGSTTLAAAVVVMATGAVVGRASVLNPQVAFGADIMSRIAFARSRPDGDAELRRVLRAGVATLIVEALGAADLDRDDVVEVAIVGNPTMLHGLQGLSLAPLGVAPYHGERYDVWVGEAGSLGLELEAAAYVGPGIRAHVGADAVAAVLATDLDRPSAPRLLMDLGTNTELVLAGPGGLYCTSAASGPAFEGAAIRHGMRAVPGAIDRLWIAPDGRVHVRTIAGEPVGLCGSGLIDAAAELLRHGVIEPSGRVRRADEVDPPLAARIVELDGQRAVRLTDGPDPVLLTAADVRELQLVKGSVGAAIRILLRTAGLDPDELDEVLMAGAFGSYVRAGSARALGLIPDIGPEWVRFVGNAAGAGARRLLVDRASRARARRIAGGARFVELAGDPDYQEAFVDMLSFPEPVEAP